jgi:hypothetical protein
MGLIRRDTTKTSEAGSSLSIGKDRPDAEAHLCREHSRQAPSGLHAYHSALRPVLAASVESIHCSNSNCPLNSLTVDHSKLQENIATEVARGSCLS